MREYRFGILLAALLGMLAYAPMIEVIAPHFPPVASRLILGLVFCWLTISAVYAVSYERKTPLVAVTLGLLLLVTEIADLCYFSRETHIASHFVAMLFLGHIVYVLLRYIFGQLRVDADTIFASLCVYLLLGMIWAFVYSLIDRFQPGSFNYAVQTQQQMRFGSGGTSLAIYFSFVTMTTLGYGDITPVSEGARGLAILQAIVGQLYLTVLVAWLVGLHVAHHRISSAKADE